MQKLPYHGPEQSARSGPGQGVTFITDLRFPIRTRKVSRQNFGSRYKKLFPGPDQAQTWQSLSCHKMLI